MKTNLTDKLSGLQASMLDRVVASVQQDERFDALLGGGSLVHVGVPSL